MSAYGIKPFGVAPGAFGGPGLVTILGLLPSGSNELIAVFDAEPLADDPFGFDSATNPKNWTLSAVDPRIPSTADPTDLYLEPGDVVPSVYPSIFSAYVDEDDETQIHLVTDVSLERGVRYQLEAQPPIRGAACEELTGVTVLEIRGLGIGAPARPRFVQVEVFRDLAYQFISRDRSTPPQNYRLTSAGDIALQSAEESLRKRLHRRIHTRPGGFAHLPGYGLNPGVKRLARTGELQRLANEAAAQALLEPDVEAAAATVEMITGADGDSAIQIRLRVKPAARETRVYLYEQPISRAA